MKFLVMKKLYDENDAYIGAKVRFSYMYITEYDELYFIKEIRQAFKFLGIPFYVNVSTNTFRIPSDFTHVMTQLKDLDSDAFADADLKGILENSLTQFEKAYETIFNSVYNAESSEQRDDLMERLYNTRKEIKALLEPWSEHELKVAQSFLESSYIPMYKVTKGSTTSYYLGKVLDDRVVVVSLEVMSFRGRKVIQLVNQFYFTRTLMSAFLDKIEKAKGDLGL